MLFLTLFFNILATTWFTLEVENTTDVGCENTTYGCCPDGISMAQGAALKGCDDDVAGLNCTDSSYGCCPDGNTTGWYGILYSLIHYITGYIYII